MSVVVPRNMGANADTNFSQVLTRPNVVPTQFWPGSLELIYRLLASGRLSPAEEVIIQSLARKRSKHERSRD